VYVQCDATAHPGPLPLLTSEDNRTVLQTVRHTVSVLHITGAVHLYNLCSKNTSVVLQNSKLQSRCKQKHTHLLNMSITAAQFQTKLECDDSCLLRYDTGSLDECFLEF
jgi:hypothetical protein